MKVLIRSALVAVFMFSATASSHASLLTIDELALNGGTIVHDGQETVTSSDGTAGGTLLTLAALGYFNAGLSDNLSLLSVDGVITNASGGTDVTLNNLRLVGLLSTPCSDCATLNDVRRGSSLGGVTETYDPGLVQNVLFAVDLVGGFSASGPALWSPSDQTPDAQVTGQEFSYSLTPDQISFIVGRIGTIDTNNILLGLAAAYNGPIATGPYGATFEVQPAQPVPEPGTLLLLAGGLSVLGVRRFGASRLH